MSDPISEERHKRASPFWGVVLIFVVVMLGIAGYSYYDHINITDDHGTTTSGRATGESPRPAPSNQP